VTAEFTSRSGRRSGRLSAKKVAVKWWTPRDRAISASRVMTPRQPADAHAAAVREDQPTVHDARPRRH
jgi:hypothetical protein